MLSSMLGDEMITWMVTLIALFASQTRPIAIDLLALDGTAQQHHDIGMAMIGPPVAVFLDGAPELRHGQHHDIFHPIP